MTTERDIIADLCACAAETPTGEAGCPHKHVPHRTRWRPYGLGLRVALRGLGLVALPAGILVAASPVQRPVPPAEVALATLAEDAGAIVKTQLQATAASKRVVKHTRATARGTQAQRQTKTRTETKRAVHAVAEALSKCRASLGDKQRWSIARAIEREARRQGYDPLFVQALVEVESTCKPTARSPRGALGLTQVRPATARAVAKEAGVPWRGAQTLLDPDLNIRLGLHYLRQMYERFGDMNVAMAAYNLGPVRAARLSRDRARKNRYVRKILARYENLRASHTTRFS